MRPLSKSKLIAFRQCPKRLWLEVHHPGARIDSATTQGIFKTGHEVGAMAQRLYDPSAEGEVIDLHAEGVAAAVARSRTVLQARKPVFEAGFCAAGAVAFADVMLPAPDGTEAGWKMVEVKSSTTVKSYHQDDAAIQVYVARAAGIDVRCVCIAHVDSTWVYPGGGDFQGLLVETDVTEAAIARSAEVAAWIDSAHQVAAQAVAPDIQMGSQCDAPFPCGFQPHCAQARPKVEFPVAWLPGPLSKALRDFVAPLARGDMRDVPDTLLNPLQRRVRDATLSGQPFFDAKGAQQDLAPHPLPAYFLDFETVQFGVPQWEGTRPFQMLPFQFSLHRLDAQGQLAHRQFLDLSGADPSAMFAKELVLACHEPIPVFVYHAGFEGSRLKELAQRLPELAPALLSICGRLVDLLPVVRSRYYHPLQRGSWGIKHVLPTIAADLAYEKLCGVHNGSMAMAAYREAIEPTTTAARKATVRAELISYCAQDTFAMVMIWKKFSSHPVFPSALSVNHPGEQVVSAVPTVPPTEPTPPAPFFSALMVHLMQGTMIPKVQVERSIGPIIGFFLANALATRQEQDIVMLCPEFPIQKASNRQSTNIDWLMLNRDTKELLLVELKTTDTTFRPEQAAIYLDLQDRIAQEASAAFLLRDLDAIGAASQERGKYQTVRKMLAQAFEVADEKLTEALSQCKTAKVIYLAPQVSKPKDWPADGQGWTWMSFADLPETLNEHEYADQWPAIRSSLVSLDALTRRLRNGDVIATAGGKNYRELLEFDELLARCRDDGAAWVIGLMDWRNVLPSMGLDQLRTKTYKCDLAVGGTGKKIDRNWVPGDLFLAHAEKALNGG